MRRDLDLTPFNTLALPARAAFYVRVTDPEQLAAPALAQTPRFILGGGSNVVLDGEFDGLVLHMGISGRQMREEADAWIVEAGAGERWSDFVQWTLAQGWPGLENLSLIPGTVGAAPVQNIGAYGLEVSEAFHRLTAFDFVERRFVELSREDCRFGYRSSLFKAEAWHEARFAIVRVAFRLPKAWEANRRYLSLAEELDRRGLAHPKPCEVADAVIALRRRKLPDPAILPNAGSFFHNPVVDAALAEELLKGHPGMPFTPQPEGRVKLAAAWLIEQAGWKGRKLGPVGMHEAQALVLVNQGGARCADVQRLMAAVQNDVFSRFGVSLTPEPVFVVKGET